MVLHLVINLYLMTLIIHLLNTERLASRNGLSVAPENAF